MRPTRQTTRMTPGPEQPSWGSVLPALPADHRRSQPGRLWYGIRMWDALRRYAAHGWPAQRIGPQRLVLGSGAAFDILEMPGPLGRAVLRGPVGGPVVGTPDGRVLFLVRPGGTLWQRIAGHPGMRLHRNGSWLPAPPTTLPNGPVRWLVAPGHTDWCPAPLSQIQAAALAVLTGAPAD